MKFNHSGRDLRPSSYPGQPGAAEAVNTGRRAAAQQKLLVSVCVAVAMLGASQSAEAQLRKTGKMLAIGSALLAPGAVVAATQVAPRQEIVGRVVGVTDGDTITVLVDGRHPVNVRLAFIDAPETSCKKKTPSPEDEACVERGQGFGKAAKKSLSSLVFGREVRVESTGTSYDRVTGRVFAGNVDVNLEQVRRGVAWVDSNYARRGLPAGEYRSYLQAESAARNQRAGLWQDANPVPPWDYRRENKSTAPGFRP